MVNNVEASDTIFMWLLAFKNTHHCCGFLRFKGTIVRDNKVSVLGLIRLHKILLSIETAMFFCSHLLNHALYKINIISTCVHI